MMLVWVLVVTALFVGDVAGTGNSSEVEETLRAISGLTKGPCEEGWFVYQPTRSCYRCFTTSKSWKDAEISCNREEHYGQLASVTSCDHNSFISKVVQQAISGSRSVWIGLRDVCENGNFRWSDESSVRYLSWADGRPRNGGSSQRCAYFYTGNNYWYDYSCRSRLYYVCAYKYH